MFQVWFSYIAHINSTIPTSNLEYKLAFRLHSRQYHHRGGWVCKNCLFVDIYFLSSRQLGLQLPHSKECKQYYPQMHLLFSHICVFQQNLQKSLIALNKQKKGNFYTVSSRLSLYTFNFGVQYLKVILLGSFRHAAVNLSHGVLEFTSSFNQCIFLC